MLAEYTDSSGYSNRTGCEAFEELENGVALYDSVDCDPEDQLAYIPFDRLSYIAPTGEGGDE